MTKTPLSSSVQELTHKPKWFAIENIFLLFAITFVLIQPFKIVSDLTGFKYLQVQFLLAPFFYFIHLLLNKNTKAILNHVYVIAFQLFIIIVHSFVSQVYFNNYFLFYLITPHFFLFSRYLYDHVASIKAFSLSISVYIIVLTMTTLISIFTHKNHITFDMFASTFDLTLITRTATIERDRILDAMNFSYYVFGTSKLTLEGVAMTVYPLVYFTLIFLDKRMAKNKLTISAIACSLVLIFLKNSRGEMLYLLLLLLYPVAEVVFRKVRWLPLLIIGFGFVQLTLSTRALNGREKLNHLFVDNISMLGKGIGFSSFKIAELTKGNFTSFHNIHFELITNFGLLVYALLIAWTVYYVISSQYDRNKHMVLCLFFFLLSTNFEFFDVYFAIPSAWALARKCSNISFSPARFFYREKQII